jgi:glycosyltransferase 2 family protein
VKRALGLALRLALVGGCLTYALWGVDFAQLGSALAAYHPWGVAAVVLAVGLDMACVGLRLRFLTGGAATFAASFNAGVLGLGLNNVLPAKLGEAAKAVYLRKAAGVSLGRSMGMIFWERFADLHALALLALGAAYMQGRDEAVVPLAALLLALWTVLASLRRWPGLGPALLRLVPFARLREFASEVLVHLGQVRGPAFFLGLAGWTASTWSLYCFQYFIVFWAAGLDLSFGQTLFVFVAGALGLAAPTSPGGVGVYEAVMVAVLATLGVDKEAALAAGLVYHAALFIPVTLYALGLLARSGLSVSALRSGQVPGNGTEEA